MLFRHHHWLFYLALSFVLGCTESSETEEDVPGDCSDECSGDSECVGDNAYKECVDLDGDGCREWTEPQSCEENQICQNGSCKAAETSCDDCEGTSRCIDEHTYQVCEDIDDDGCKEWSENRSCQPEEICSEDACSAKQQECPEDSCEGTSRCVDEHTYQVCEDTDDDGCKEWSEVKTCQPDEICSDLSCTTATPVCNNECSQEGDIQCSDNKQKTCTDNNQDGCLEWGNEVPCEYGCSENQCRKYPECPENAKICPKIIEKFNEQFERFQAGEPVQYILKTSNFLGLDLYVDNRVLIPRQETEEVATQAYLRALSVFKDNVINIADVCCGSGCLGIYLAKKLKSRYVFFSDISSDAIDVAKQNAKNLDVIGNFFVGNALDELVKAGAKVDLLVANPPYILKREDVDQSVLDHEPHLALFADEELSVYRDIFKKLPLVKNKRLLAVFEIGYDLKEKLIKLIYDTLPDCTYAFAKDINGKERILILKVRQL